MTPGARRPGDSADVHLPEVDDQPIAPAPGEASIIEQERPVIRQLAGAWEQLDCGDSNEADFAPGGYQRSVIVIDGHQEECFLYRGFGPLGTAPVFNVSGQFHLTMAKDGTALVGASLHRPSSFPTQARTIPIVGGGSVKILPPTTGVYSTKWSTDPDRNELTLGGKRYRRASDDVRERVIRGDPPLADSALDDAVRRTVQAVDTGTASATGAGAPAPPSAGSTVDFFGLQIRGRHVSFLIDCSGSMAGAKLASALAELHRAIAALPKGTSFHVVFFASRAYDLPGYTGWIDAQSPRAAALLVALQGVGPQGGTDPTEALQISFALAPRPDEVFLMTDGQMAGNPRALILSLNGTSRARTRVNTIAFGADADQQVLSDIASDNLGSFRAVP